MYECPGCKQSHKSRKNGRCPGCGLEVEVHDGRWYPSGTGSPSEAILQHFEQRLSQQLSAATGEDTFFRVPRKGSLYKRELVAARQMLDRAGGELDVVKASVDLLFDHPKFSWKTRSTLLGINRDFDQALSVIRARLEREKQEAVRMQTVYDEIRSRENIFG